MKKQMEKLLKVLNINVTLFNLLMTKNKEYYNDRKYKRKYSYEYNLILTLQLKNDLNNWRALSKLNIYDSNTKYHFKVINSQFIRWTNKGIFKKAFEESKSKFINDDNKELLIDTTAFNNKYGIENKVINSEYKKKNLTKLSAITNKKNKILSIVTVDIKEKEIIFNKKIKKIKTSSHDISNVQKTLNNINIKTNLEVLVGDKGYKTQEKFKYLEKEIKIITPDKKNQKNNLNTTEEKKKISGRYKIENTFSSIKLNNERIFLRKDKKMKSFMSWVYISCTDII